MYKVLFSLLFLNILTNGYSQGGTWSGEIASLVYKKCSGCHHPGGIAPFSLLTYQDMQNHKNSIEDAVSNKIMPPWPPDDSYATYAHSRKLSDSEYTKMINWFTNNMPEGNPANTPPIPNFPKEGFISTPADLVYEIPEYTSTASTQDVYRYFAIPSNLATDVFIKGIEVIPGNSGIVHHVLVYQDNTGQLAAKDAADPLPGFSGGGTLSGSLVAGWVPGAVPEFYPYGMAIKIKKAADIILQIHYPKGSSGQKDKTKVKMFFSSAPNPREITNAPVLNYITSMTNGPLVIPANTTKTFFEEYSIPGGSLAKLSVLGVAPHMHLIGTSIKSYAQHKTNGTIIPFINIPEWDFHWQGTYFFKHPKTVDGNYLLKAEAVYDNTTNNPDNPNNPPKLVTAGEATTDEMMLVYFQYLTYQSGDELIDLDTVLTTAIPDITLNQSNTLRISPNPASNYILIPLEELNQNSILSIYRLDGKLIHKFHGPFDSPVFPIDELEPGAYLVQLVHGSGTSSCKLIKPR